MKAHKTHVFQDLYSSIAPPDISNLSQKAIQHALDNEKFHGLKENLACERESDRLLSLSVRHAGACLSAPTIPAPMVQNEILYHRYKMLHMVQNEIWYKMKLELVQNEIGTNGTKWNKMKLELVQSTGWVSLSTTPKGSARSVKQEFLTSMGIKPLRVMVEETQLQDMTGFEIK